MTPEEKAYDEMRERIIHRFPRLTPEMADSFASFALQLTRRAVEAERSRAEAMETYAMTAIGIMQDAANTCYGWADESRRHGWSTHQVGANIKLGDKLNGFAGEISAAIRARESEATK